MNSSTHEHQAADVFYILILRVPFAYIDAHMETQNAYKNTVGINALFMVSLRAAMLLFDKDIFSSNNFRKENNSLQINLVPHATFI